MAQHLGQREVLEKCDEVGERLVKGEDVRITRFAEAPVHAVEQCVRHLVRNNVVRQASEHREARQVATNIGHRGWKISEQYCLFLWTVVSVRFS